MHCRRTIDLELADEGLGEISGDAGGDACRGLQRRQDGQVSHLHRALLLSKAIKPEFSSSCQSLMPQDAPGQIR